MNSAFHIDASKRVALACGWPGDVNLLARNAAYPDEVRAVLVEGLGAHAFGHNFAAFTHFCKPVEDEAGWSFRGYNYSRDASLPQLPLPDKHVTAEPYAWGPPILSTFWDDEPLAALLNVLEGHASTAADHLTFPTAANMASWVELNYEELDAAPDRSTDEQAILAGYMLHFVQDCCVPHHVLGVLLAGHSEFEAAIDDLWRTWAQNGRADRIIMAEQAKAIHRTPVRTICEAAALESRVSLGWLRFCRAVWAPGWTALMEAAMERALRRSTQLLRSLATPRRV